MRRTVTEKKLLCKSFLRGMLEAQQLLESEVNSTNTGGPAFPVPDIDGSAVQEGMTLRDYFAAKAMEAHIGRNDVWEAMAQERVTPEKICSGCYAWADAMLKVRAA